MLQNQANLSDIATKLNDAYRAEVEKNIELARQLWIRVNIAASGSDIDATDAISRLSNSINYSKSSDNKSFDYQGNKSLSPKVAKKNKSTSTTNISKINSNFVAGVIGVVVSGISLFVGLDVIGFDVTKMPPPAENKLTTIENKLTKKEWKAADYETAKLMLKVAGRKEEEPYLSIQDIKNFPCTDLRTIDQLWVKYSDGKFGFSVQKKIYQSLGGKKEHNREVWEKFGEKVGWRKGDEWLNYDELTWTRDTDTHYTGHLPLGRCCGVMVWDGARLSRAETCSL